MDEKLLGKCGVYCGACPTYINGGYANDDFKKGLASSRDARMVVAIPVFENMPLEHPALPYRRVKVCVLLKSCPIIHGFIPSKTEHSYFQSAVRIIPQCLQTIAMEIKCRKKDRI